MENRLKKLTQTAVMAALIASVTVLVRIPVGASGAYVNAGDAVIYICAYMLGGLYTAIAAGIGGMLADIIAGAGVYILPTLVIKAVMGIVCGAMLKKITKMRFLLASFVGGAVMTSGYALFEWMFFGAAYAISMFIGNVLQWVCTVVIAFVLYLALEKFDIRRKI